LRYSVPTGPSRGAWHFLLLVSNVGQFPKLTLVHRQATEAWLPTPGAGDTNTHLHIPYNHAHGLTGTATFASIHSHLGLELGRRDDLKLLAYILIYFLCGSLPWQGLYSVKDIAQCKQRATHKLCHGLPVEFHDFLDYCYSLTFDGKPNYDHFCRLFSDLLS